MILVSGASGYVGGRLLRALLGRGEQVRAMGRKPEVLRARLPNGVEVVGGDCLDRASLSAPMTGARTAYYLVHSLAAGADYEERDRLAARNFAAAAHVAGVERIVYLGGLTRTVDGGAELSHHLQSRLETGEVLRAGEVPVVELRASVVIGSGSVSFELIRALTERLPLMICPRWVSTLAQPIAIEDVIAYLVAAADLPRDGLSHVYEIGGADRVSYGDLMREYARQRGLRRMLISVPLLTPHLSSLWLGLITPVYARIGRELIDGLRNPSVVADDSALRAFDIRPLGLRKAIARALANEDREFAETRWSDTLPSGSRPTAYGGQRVGSRLVDSRSIEVTVGGERAFAPIRMIGGRSGWYFGNWLWRVRGALDLLLGGVGMRRGRRDPGHLRLGDIVDFWRVEAVEDGRRLLLAAEMRMPGRAWLEFEVVERAPSRTTIRQTAIFDPAGVGGLLYWYALYPIHALIFGGMLRAIGALARRAD